MRRAPPDRRSPLASWSCCSRSSRSCRSTSRVVLNGPLDKPGTLQLLALCLVFAGVALTYDLLFGFTGLLSFGHALYVALGVYVTAIALTSWEWGLSRRRSGCCRRRDRRAPRARRGSLRVGGIAFAMVTLAFAQAGTVLVQKNPVGLTGGEEGIGLNFDEIPDFVRRRPQHEEPLLACPGLCVAVFVVVRAAVGSSAGHVWRAMRENEPRVEVLGLNPYPFKLIAFVLARSSPCWAGSCGCS